ncbi:hypothetical protein M5K25_002500 [Dendrobium thyrsiflorum]|uniref:non-specific serine/threonine protein kinase n=1 Tax=Dendrobium thyrsiflorum TaxID=117978 RepID=A0ABD0VNC4_DENTH
MSFFSCFSFDGKKKSKKHNARRVPLRARLVPVSHQESESRSKLGVAKQRAAAKTATEKRVTGNGNIAAQTFTFRELAAATKNFRPECLLGEGGFGRVYKGRLEKTGQVVAIKQLDRNGLQGNREFLVEVLMLSLLHHEHLVNLIGYCADGEQRLLVYEYMALGSLEDHLLEISPNQTPLSWFTRMQIAFGAAKGLEYMHEKATPPVIYRDLKSSNILLNEDYIPKLSDFGLAKLGSLDEKANVSSRVMGTYGYCAPEYARTGQLTIKSDVYSFGVVLLELITGKRVIDTRRPTKEQNLVASAQPMFKDQNRYPELVDPLLGGNYPSRGLNQAVAVAAMCLQEDASVRPVMADVVVALSYLQGSPCSVVDGSSNHHQPLLESQEDDIPNIHGILVDKTTMNRQHAVAEAIRWGSNNSRNGQRSRRGTGPL